MVYDGILLGLIVGLLRGGWRRGVANLGRIRLKGGWIFPVLLAAQVLIFIGQRRLEWLSDAGGIFLMAVYAAAIAFLWINRVKPGFKTLIVGVAMNFVVMLANGGKMPVSREMAVMANPDAVSMLELGHGTKHVIMTESSRLPFLADVVPVTLPYPLPQVISLGDIVMNVGVFWFLYRTLAAAPVDKQEGEAAAIAGERGRGADRANSA